LFCAHGFRLKGLDVAIAAVGAVGGAHLLVVGAGDPSPYLNLAAEQGLEGRLTFLGSVADMPQVYRGAGFLIHPSRYDPCSLVVTEALACGLPVIVSARDGASEHVRHGANGYVVADCEDAATFSEHVAVLDDPAQRATCAAAAAEFRRPWSRVATELLEAIS
jgi:UDP-glucose:(heptosyl)LPS alpha-1,3-glucosyltransferase